jgi:hypothetical protein
MPKPRGDWQSAIARILIGVVLFLNLQCSWLFLASPQFFVAGFELSGIPGEAMVRGMGVLFLMWNIPYLFAFTQPIRRKTSLIEAFCMQAAGLVGEILILFSLPSSHDMLRSTGIRFIVFDGGGLLFLFAALWIVSRSSPLIGGSRYAGTSLR